MRKKEGRGLLFAIAFTIIVMAIVFVIFGLELALISGIIGIFDGLIFGYYWETDKRSYFL